MLIDARSTCRKSRLCAAAFAALAVLLSTGRYAMGQGDAPAPPPPPAAPAAPPPSIRSIIPKDIEFASGVRADWLWQTTQSIREEPHVSKALADFQTKSGIDIESDVIPWAGEIDNATVSLNKTDVVLVYAQIRDQSTFDGLMTTLRDKMQASGVNMNERTYHGDIVVDLSSASAPKKMGPVAVALLNGWIVAGVGKGAIECALDAYNGKTPSLASSIAWTTAFNHLPTDANAWLAVDPLRIANSHADSASITPQAKSALAMAQNQGGDIAVAFTDEGTGFRVDSCISPTDAAGKALYTQMAQKLHPLSGQILKRAPDAVLAWMINDPGYFWHLIKSYALAAASTPAERNQIQSSFAGVPIDSELQYFTKDAGLVITWRPDRGYGLVLFAQADNHLDAVKAAAAIALTLKKQGAPIVRGGNSWVLSMPGMDMMIPPTVPVKLQPFMSAKDDWLVIGSHPAWTFSTSAPNLGPPADAVGSPIMGLLSLKFMPSLLDLLAKQPGAADNQSQQVIGLIRSLNLQDSVWSSYGVTDPTGNWSSGTGRVDNWDWHAAIAAIVKAVDTWQTTPAGKNQVPPVGSAGEAPSTKS